MGKSAGYKGRMEGIQGFRGNYSFLSNFYRCNLIVEDVFYLNAEAAFQAQKVLGHQARQEFSYMQPAEAKKAGRKVLLREDWEKVKFDKMYQICKAKFTQNPELKEKLLATGDTELVEENTWGDTVWGTCGGRGENHLGRILMRVREEIKEIYDGWTTDILDVFEDILFDYGMTIPLDYEPEEGSDARIYGEPYFRIRQEVGNILRHPKIA